MSMDRYEEAMSRCKQWEREHTKGYVIQDMIEFIFPELANEDEKIKRAISYAIAQVKHEDGILIDRITEDMALSWLEKQKEQKPVKIVSRDEYVKRFKALCGGYEINLPNREYDIYHLCDDLSKLSIDSGKQKPLEWSENDETKKERLISRHFGEI